MQLLPTSYVGDDDITPINGKDEVVCHSEYAAETERLRQVLHVQSEGVTLAEV